MGNKRKYETPKLMIHGEVEKTTLAASGSRKDGSPPRGMMQSGSG